MRIYNTHLQNKMEGLRETQARHVAVLQCLVGLVGLLEQVRHQALVGLRGVPRAAAGRAQPVHHGHDVEQAGARRVVGRDHHLIGLGHQLVAVHRQPHHRLPGGDPRPCLLHRDDGDVDAGRAQGRQLPVTGVCGHHRAPVHRLPGRPGQQPGREAGRADEHDEPARH